jgi:hypothetical protein
MEGHEIGVVKTGTAPSAAQSTVFMYIVHKMLTLEVIDKCVLSSEVLKGYSLFLVYKTNIFIKLLKLV